MEWVKNKREKTDADSRKLPCITIKLQECCLTCDSTIFDSNTIDSTNYSSDIDSEDPDSTVFVQKLYS